MSTKEVCQENGWHPIRRADQRAVSYTEYGLPTQITRNGVQWQFGYDATHRRATKTGPGGSTIYVGSLYEKRVNSDGTESHVMYVLAGADVKAQIVVNRTGGGEEIDYLMRDHLGSVTRARGDGTWQDMRFDPYGSRILATPPPTSVADNPSSRVRLGFTGQEEDDDLGLVNMNGRIYDPVIARFLTPDPLVSMRSPSQSWNRYSYAENSPLRFVDPSGFIGEDGSGGNGGYEVGPQPPYICGNFGCSANPSYGVSGNYGTSPGGAGVGSFDEAGAGASAGITAGMIQLQQQQEGGDIQARGWDAAEQGGSSSGNEAWDALVEARDSGTLEAKRGMRTLSARTGVNELVVDRDSATLTIEYRNGTSKTLPAAVQESGDFVPAQGMVRGTAWNPESRNYENTRIPWNVSNENPYGPAIILVDGTEGRHIHGTNGPMNGGLPYIGGDDPVGRQITHGCARITNDQIVILTPQIAATLRAGYTIGVIFQ